MDPNSIPSRRQRQGRPSPNDTCRVVAKVAHHAGELFPRVGFIVTNLTLPSRAVARFYNKRGTSERNKTGRSVAWGSTWHCKRD